MSRTVSLSAMRDRARRLANVVNDPNVLDADLTDLVNLHVTKVYDTLVAAGPPDYYASSAPITTVGGQILYPLPADFLSLCNVYAKESPDLRRPILPFTDKQRQSFKAPSGSGWVVEIEYVPAAPTLSDAGINTFDGINGWEELISAHVALHVLSKREGDASIVNEIIATETARIRSRASQRDKGGPKYVQDVEQGYVWPRSVRLDGYRLRAGNIELYESVWGWP